MKRIAKALSIVIACIILCSVFTACMPSYLKDFINDASAEPTPPAPVDLSSLEDSALIQAVLDNIYYKTIDCSSREEELPLLNEYERNFYVAFWFDSEVQWDGLYYYFYNCGYAYLPYTESSLTAVGATSHAKLFTDFCDENQININDETVKNFRDNEDIFKKKMGTFDEFDTEYYSLVENDPIEPLLAEYVRNNVEHFEW